MHRWHIALPALAVLGWTAAPAASGQESLPAGVPAAERPAGAPAAIPGTRVAETHPLAGGVRALVARARDLVERARFGESPATQFRIDAVLYREGLRQLATENAALPEADRIPRDTVMAMVRMSALLQAAAECQTGRYIVCPADLMVRLTSQVRELEAFAPGGAPPATAPPP
jgi:hypothetical protein